MKKVLLILVALFTILSGCGSSESETASGSDCEDEIKALLESRGEPGNIDTYVSEGKQSHSTYWYYCEGYSKTFRWGPGIGGCAQREDTFTPICNE